MSLPVKNEVAKSVESYLNNISYGDDEGYVPSEFALEFVTFIKLVDGGMSENRTPVVHYKMIDNFILDNGLDTINMCHRGIAKSTLKEYLILYIGMYNELPNFGTVPYAIYVSDSIENGVKKMRKSLEFRWNNSEFLQKYVPKMNLTDLRWEFINASGKSFVVSGFGAKTGVRGTRENGSRPVLALLDDLISDEDARSPTVIEKVEDTIDKAIDYALHPKKRKVIWSGTPFNSKDPLYKSVESGAYNVNVYPVCEKFPCSREEFRGSWEDRFDYDYVLKQYEKSVKKGTVASFNQELMLRIMSEEDQLVSSKEILWYQGSSILSNMGRYNFYITTDFATSERNSGDYSVISVWALDYKGNWFWVDGICKRQFMDANINDLFTFAQMYNPISVGVEVSGQQGGFISWIRKEMIDRNIMFNLASQHNSNQPGIRPTKDKMTRFHTVLPLFKTGKIFFPSEKQNTSVLKECVEELTLASKGGFKSKHDDFIDTISMLADLQTFRPSEEAQLNYNTTTHVWEHDDDMGDTSSTLESYIV